MIRYIEGRKCHIECHLSPSKDNNQSDVHAPSGDCVFGSTLSRGSRGADSSFER
jgi:hypothetical protein